MKNTVLNDILRTLNDILRTLNALIVAFVLMVANQASFAAEPAPLPETMPWDVKRLSEPPKFEWASEPGAVRSLYYTGEPYNGKPTRVFAYYAAPRAKGVAGQPAEAGTPTGRAPAIVLVHGGGGTAFREWADLWAQRGYAAIAMDLAGHQPMEDKNPHDRNNRTRLADGGPNQGDDEKFGSIMKEPGEQWPYHAVANVMLAHSLIRSLPEVDPDRTAVTGISWGGYLTCIVAGVDSRFKAAVPVYGCGFLQENSAWVERLGKMKPEERERWTTLWDPKQYLPAVKMPILFVNGTNDFAYPLDSYLKCYDLVLAEKQLRITVNMPHGHPPGWAPQEIGLFVDQVLLKTPPLPKPGEPKLEGKTIKLACTGPTKPTAAALHYTTGEEAINKRTWETVPATVNGAEVTAAAPPGNATAWFLTVVDERKAVVSTRVVLP